MPLYKIWNAARTLKKAAVAETLEILISRGTDKGILPAGTPQVDVTVVLEKDGTVVDDNETLLALEGVTLLLLTHGEVWRPDQTVSPATLTALATVAEPAAPATLADPATLAIMAAPATPVTPASPATPATPVTPATAERMVSAGGETSFSQEDKAVQLEKAPLPKLSPGVMRHLQGDDARPEPVWNMLINEVAMYYLGNWPDIGDQSHYKIIGARMFKAFPSIALDGPSPWSAFNKSLSQRIRHIRHRQKVTSQKSFGEPQPPPEKKRCFRPLQFSSTTQATEVSQDDTERHTTELQNEWSKSSRNSEHIKKLMRYTRQAREQLIRASEDGAVARIFNQYPCFEESDYVLFEFGLLLGNDRLRKAGTNLKNIIVALEELADIEPPMPNEQPDKNPMRIKPALDYAEKKVKFHQGKNTQKEKSIVLVKEDVADEDIPKELETKAQESPRIVAFTTSGFLTGLFIVADTKYTKVNKDGGLIAAIFKLIAMYYIFDLKYPKPYQNILGLFQTFVMEEAFKQTTSKGYKILSKDLRKTLATFEKS